MLEVLTMQYVSIPELGLIAIALGYILLGGVLSALIGPRPALPLSRSYFYLRLGLASFLLALPQLLWMLYIPALKLGVTFLFMATDAVSLTAYGAYLAHIARARSRDAYGEDNRAWMAFVPLVNLVLVFRASLPPLTALRSASAAWVGIVLFVLSRLVTAAIENNAAGAAFDVANDPEAVAIIESLTLRAEGIEAALDRQVAAETVPQQIGPTLLLSTVRREGTTIIYDYVVDEPDITGLNDDYRRETHSAMCAALMAYLEAGASADIRYTRADGLALETLRLTVMECTA